MSIERLCIQYEHMSKNPKILLTCACSIYRENIIKFYYCLYQYLGEETKQYIHLVLTDLFVIINRANTPKTLLENTGESLGMIK